MSSYCSIPVSQVVTGNFLILNAGSSAITFVRQCTLCVHVSVYEHLVVMMHCNVVYKRSLS